MSETKTPTHIALADPDDEHRLPESNDPVTEAEREDLGHYYLHEYVNDPTILAAYRAGWDRGVADLAFAAGLAS